MFRFAICVILASLAFGSAAKASISTSITDLNGSRGFSTNLSNGVYELNANFSTSKAAIADAQVNYYQSDLTTVNINMYFGGRMKTNPMDTMVANQWMQSTVGSKIMSEYASTGCYSYDPTQVGKGLAPAGTTSAATMIFVAYGNAGINFSADDVSYIYGQGYYNTNSYTDNGHVVTWFYFNPSWQLQFSSAKAAAEFMETAGSLGSVVPEPASVATLMFGLVGLATRRRRAK